MDDKSQLRQNLMLALITAVLAFVGSAGGILITSAQQRADWERSTGFDQRQKILDTRVDLIERTVRLISQANTARVLANQAEGASALREDRETLMALNSEFAATLALDAIYFGPQTKQAVAAVLQTKDRWWDADETLRRNLVTALSTELMYNLETSDAR
jgi:hypothetical protein